METILGRICILCSLSLIISGCASSPSLTTTSSFNAFLNGDVRLDCNLPCSFKFGWNLPDIQKLYEAGKWQESALYYAMLLTGYATSWLFRKTNKLRNKLVW